VVSFAAALLLFGTSDVQRSFGFGVPSLYNYF